MCCGNASMKWRQAGVYRFFAGGPFWATAAFTSALNAPASTFSPSWMSIALRVLPSKLELKRPDGSGILAPRANVSFTTFVYVSPVHPIPWCDQTGVPLHFHSSVISGSASMISARMRALIMEADPEMTEEGKWRGTPVWSHHGIGCTGETYTKVVKLTFARGASIPDPSGLFNSSLEGNTRRAIDIHEGEKVDAGAFKALVKAAVAQNGPPAKKR